MATNKRSVKVIKKEPTKPQVERKPAPPPQDVEDFLKYLESVRTEKRLTFPQLSEIIGAGASTIAKWNKLVDYKSLLKKIPTFKARLDDWLLSEAIMTVDVVGKERGQFVAGRVAEVQAERTIGVLEEQEKQLQGKYEKINNQYTRLRYLELPDLEEKLEKITKELEDIKNARRALGKYIGVPDDQEAKATESTEQKEYSGDKDLTSLQ